MVNPITIYRFFLSRFATTRHVCLTRITANKTVLTAHLRQTFFTTLLVFITPLSAQAAFTASVDRTTIASHESLELTLRTDESTKVSPDLGTLAESFDLLGIRQQQSTRIVNGRSSYARDWIVTIMPRKQGKLTIPAISLGDQQTQPITITVRDDNIETTATGPLLMTAEVSSKSIYVQQELLLSVQILFSIPLYDDNRLSALDISDALVQQLGETRKFDTVIDGVRYQGFELKYAIHPQTAGELTIPSLTFSGVAADPRESFIGGIFSSSGRPVQARSPEIEVTVKPRPDNFPANEPWLPARQLTIEEQWSQPLSNLKVGDAITRTITVTADGLSAAQLPPILMPQPRGVNSYPDKSNTQDRDTLKGIQGQRTDSIAMIPTQPGKITLPAIDYPWFDTDSGEVRMATIPAIDIDVAPAPQTTTLATSTPVATPAQCPPTVECPTQGDRPLWQTAAPWQGLSTLFALLWLITLGLWRAKVRTGHDQQPTFSEPSEATAFSRLEAACKQGDGQQALDELKNWSRVFWQNEQLASLSQCLKQNNSTALSNACNQILSARYGTKPATTDVTPFLNDLLEACRTIRHRQKSRSDEPLGDLYPQ